MHSEIMATVSDSFFKTKLKHKHDMEGKVRKLPAWMQKNVVSPDTEKGKEEERPLLLFRGTVDYCPSLGDCGFVCEQLICEAEGCAAGELYVGFDTEWPVHPKTGSGKTALIQVCAAEDTCHLFHVASMGNVPKAFVCFLEHPKIKFVGLNIVNDFWKLGRDLDIAVKSLIESKVVDVGHYANAVLNCGQNWSLDRLVLHLLKRTLDKSDSVRKSDWTAIPLDSVQQRYAATDAYVSLLVYKHLRQLEEANRSKGNS